MPTHFQDDGTVILRHEFNTSEQQDLIKKQRTLSFDDYGDVHLVYTSVAEHAPELGLELKRLAVLNLLAKIQTELRKFAAATKQESVEHLLMQLPSLVETLPRTAAGNASETTNHIVTGKQIGRAHV